MHAQRRTMRSFFDDMTTSVLQCMHGGSSPARWWGRSTYLTCTSIWMRVCQTGERRRLHSQGPLSHASIITCHYTYSTQPGHHIRQATYHWPKARQEDNLARAAPLAFIARPYSPLIDPNKVLYEYVDASNVRPRIVKAHQTLLSISAKQYNDWEEVCIHYTGGARSLCIQTLRSSVQYLLRMLV